MNPVTLLSIAISFGLTALIAGFRNHWAEFGFFLFITFFSIMGMVVSLL